MLIRHLVDKGADLMATNARGWTPLDIALGQPDERIAPNDESAALLRELGGRSGVSVASSAN